LSAEDFKIDDCLVSKPNKGNFTIQFTSQSETVKVLVHDLLGRKLFDKKYESNTSIKHSVAAIANRIYLLTVIDGDRKEVKKLVIEWFI
jgi:hypothetical protein